MTSSASTSVYIHVYSIERTAEKTIRSALGQNGGNFEVLVANNQSTDRTFEIAWSFSDQRPCVVRNDANLGAYRNHSRHVRARWNVRGAKAVLAPRTETVAQFSLEKGNP
jgi:cellulose synthase/poly-beta-1,6-N-acetylglucosamine synthase-like glycosyltransferase